LYISTALPPLLSGASSPSPDEVEPITVPIVPLNIPPFDNRIAGHPAEFDGDVTVIPEVCIINVVPSVIIIEEYSITDDDDDDDDDEEEEEIVPPSSTPMTCVPPSSYIVLDVVIVEEAYATSTTMHAASGSSVDNAATSDEGGIMVRWSDGEIA
jgi:hypothetical protein